MLTDALADWLALMLAEIEADALWLALIDADWLALAEIEAEFWLLDAEAEAL